MSKPKPASVYPPIPTSAPPPPLDGQPMLLLGFSLLPLHPSPSLLLLSLLPSSHWSGQFPLPSFFFSSSPTPRSKCANVENRFPIAKSDKRQRGRVSVVVVVAVACVVVVVLHLLILNVFLIIDIASFPFESLIHFHILNSFSLLCFPFYFVFFSLSLFLFSPSMLIFAFSLFISRFFALSLCLSLSLSDLQIFQTL